MSIQTSPGVPDLDATDFKFSFAGATIGLELRYTPTLDGAPVPALLLCERLASGAWEYKMTVGSDFMTQLRSLGAMQWLKTVALPSINAWLATRFAGVPGGPADDPNIPNELEALDGLMAGLEVTVVNGVPVLTVEG